MALRLPLLLGILAALPPLPPLSPHDLTQIGRRVWQNEADGKIEGLTAWNTGEDFPSLGIGHFIWYPAGKRGPFEESFPTLLQFLKERGVALPPWLSPSSPCPWNSRAAFLAELHSPRLQELRTLLAATLAEQSQFLAQRLDRALPSLLAALPEERRPALEKNYRLLAASPAGRFALIDYVNFKGEGTNPSERYQGEGWGLLQVLLALPPNASPALFAKAAEQTLQRRVRNAPPERHEERWLPGWTKRVQAYASP
ncbi:MAG: hypothetical protein RLZZ142_2879 [Verrucomicrobiota bacterium]